jgi:hypothetical protein
VGTLAQLVSIGSTMQKSVATCASAQAFSLMTPSILMGEEAFDMKYLKSAFFFWA